MKNKSIAVQFIQNFVLEKHLAINKEEQPRQFILPNAIRSHQLINSKASLCFLTENYRSTIGNFAYIGLTRKTFQFVFFFLFWYRFIIMMLLSYDLRIRHEYDNQKVNLSNVTGRANNKFDRTHAIICVRK